MNSSVLERKYVKKSWTRFIENENKYITVNLAFIKYY